MKPETENPECFGKMEQAHDEDCSKCKVSLKCYHATYDRLLEEGEIP